MDVIALDRAGIAEVVAPNGTAVTEAQLERMWRLDPAPILCFDGDSAGRKAAIRAALRALPCIGPERTLRFVELPAGQDPDDVVKRRRPRGVRGAARQAPSRSTRACGATSATPRRWPRPRPAPASRQRLIAHAEAIGRRRPRAALYRERVAQPLRRASPPQRQRRAPSPDRRAAASRTAASSRPTRAAGDVAQRDRQRRHRPTPPPAR